MTPRSQMRTLLGCHSDPWGLRGVCPSEREKSFKIGGRP
jgi:hypothetical protein